MKKERVKVTVEVKYLYRPGEVPPCRASICIYLPAVNEGARLTPLLRGEEGVLGEPLSQHWGNWNDKWRSFSADVVAPCWDDLEGRVEAVVARSLKTLRAVANRNRRALREKPADFRREVLI